MIHVATAHIGSPRWLEVQLRYLRRTIGETPFRVVASVEGFDVPTGDELAQVIEHAGPHAGKLNALAAEIASSADADDWLMFLDGDAFPIRDPVAPVARLLEATPLVAIRRDENAGDAQPHPSFCVTTVGTWVEIQGDWSPGHLWRAPDGSAHTDVGGNLLRLLELHDVPWSPLLRSNAVDLHPVWFGIYGGIVYHHGAGFRAPVSRQDQLDAAGQGRRATSVPGLDRISRRLDARRRARAAQAQRAGMTALSNEVFGQLASDFEFYRRFE